MIRSSLVLIAAAFFSIAFAQGPRVVASTSWAAAFAEAAGVQNVAVIAPAGLLHPPDYDPRPSDLLAIDRADFVLVGGFEGFVDRLHRAVGNTRASLIQVELINDPEVIRREIRRLAEVFGTEDEAEAWLAEFDEEMRTLQTDLRALVGDRSPVVIAHRFMAPWAELADLELAAMYGPAPVTPSELSRLVDLEPDVILGNSHTGGSEPLMRATDARVAMLINFPGEDEGLIDVFHQNAERIVSALTDSTD